MRQLSLTTIATRYPKSVGFMCSLLDQLIEAGGRAGAGLFAPGYFEGFSAILSRATSFDAEIKAVLEATEKVAPINSYIKRVVFFTDSQAAILCLCSAKAASNSLIKSTKEAKSKLINGGWEVVYQSISSHCGVLDNERVDGLAKQGSTCPPARRASLI